ncbi:MAG: FAA hydrolase family protein [Mesorhizobium sp.]|uniref:fumarylacetoacetate hydrolase family protein n=1 Tax=Mesorhizobium sp. TaxID=1871066 RepID=UPI000FE5B4D4|nr:fumarylacetoacetate hydrolase family protein [Mesorhizobium sp.]RWC49747.1 MAG: FAA hydrolase family protein [Mesorhizobium sp.]
MKLGSLKVGGRDGTLVIVSSDLSKRIDASDIVPTLREAIESWSTVEPALRARATELAKGAIAGAVAFDPTEMASPLPRSFQWVDGSAYLSHMRLVRKARGAEVPSDAETNPLVYQGGSDIFLGPTDDIVIRDISWGLDFESEVAVIVDDVACGTSAEEAKSHIKLVMLCNDISLREVMRPELQKGFGFFQSKPASAFSPVCVTLDELGSSWNGGKLCLPLTSTYNGQWFGSPDAGKDLSFDFPALIAHAAMTRDLAAGTIIGSGTVSNNNHHEVGSSCLAERRTIQIIEKGATDTPFMKPGDTVRIEMLDAQGVSIFGAIEQKVVASS